MTLTSQSESPLPEIGRRLETGSIITNFHDAGAGAPVLLIHGSGPGVTAWANWRMTIPALSRGMRVVAPDMAGFGYTETSLTDYEPGIWVSQVVDLLDALDLPKVSIVGNSFGGSIALRFASMHPDRVADLVLMGPVGLSFPLTTGLDRVWGYQPSLENMRKLLDVFVFDEGLITEDLVELRYRASVRADVQQRFEAMFPAPRQRWVDRLALDVESLARINQRTLILHGRNDAVIPLEASERLVTVLPNAELVAIDRCGHWVQIEQATIFNDALQRFLFCDRSASQQGRADGGGGDRE
ncbi:alpha/beta fold hydrolase [Paraburkholderia caribensis]|uniref:alpha/beta fold hydrolase n=1 Tax=Paraburkholderia caribensis TaxID=75105 RepID=UPI001CB0ABFA|nr:alpha/beta fold hydrolase [Paraburkholderia caribensis]CAG9263068.1 2-hydroxy-6-oxo-2,4-heptadienoate hydrolase [Paraburkholderia caribensis]